VSPLTGDLISLLPQQHFTFATALKEGCVARWWWASAADPHTVYSLLHHRSGDDAKNYYDNEMTIN
jgi:hypothetical protein